MVYCTPLNRESDQRNVKSDWWLDFFTNKMWSKRFWTSNFATVLKVSTVLFKSNKFLETPGCRFPQEITESFLLGGKPAAEAATNRENPQKITHVLPLDWQVCWCYLLLVSQQFLEVDSIWIKWADKKLLCSTSMIRGRVLKGIWGPNFLKDLH